MSALSTLMPNPVFVCIPVFAVKGPSGKMLRGFKYRAAKKGSEDGAWPPPHCKVGVYT